MFVGHAAVAGLAGAARPRVPLLPLFLAAYAADAVEILLHGAGVPHRTAMLWSHSVTALLVGGLLSAAVAWLFSRSRETAIVVGLVHASHGLADLLTGIHKPTWHGGPTYGLGLYERPVVDFTIEVGLLLAAALLYWRRRPVPGRRIATVVTLLVLLQLGFNLGDRAWLHGLKRDLIRVTGAAFDSATASG